MILRMRELLLATALLSTVSSEDFENKKHLTALPDVEPNFWPARGRRSSWSDLNSEFGSLFENDERNLHRNSEPHYLLQDPQQSSSLSFIRYMEKEPHLWSDDPNQLISPRPSKYSTWTSPPERRTSHLAPFDCYKFNDDTVVCERQGCGSKRGRRESQRWRRQEPIYVEEPNWIEIDPNDYLSSGAFGNREPFFVARGKKQTSPGVIDHRHRRRLSNLLESYSSKPFFITRGKRSVERSSSRNSEKVTKQDSADSFKQDSAVELVSKKAKTREVKGFQTGEQYGVPARRKRSMPVESSQERFSLPRDKRDAYEERSSDRFELWQRNGSHGNLDQLQSSLVTRIKSRDDELKAAMVQQKEKNEHEAAKRPQHPHSRNAQSNFLDISREPFFISRGKKSSFYPSEEEVVKDVDDFELELFEEEKSHILDDANALRRRKLSNLLNKLEFRMRHDGEVMENNESLEFIHNLQPHFVIRNKKTQHKPPRSRRGMLDELLRTSDPFFVSRGKRFDNDKSGFFPKHVYKNGVDSDHDNEVLAVQKFKVTKPVEPSAGLSKLESLSLESSRQIKDLNHDRYNESDQIEQSDVKSVFSQKTGTYDDDVQKYIANSDRKSRLDMRDGLN